MVNAEAVPKEDAGYADGHDLRHVMTFDGKVYSVLKSGSQCTYLMARGTRRENFVLVKSHDGITLTLPEMAVTITKYNFVRLNNSVPTWRYRSSRPTRRPPLNWSENPRSGEQEWHQAKLSCASDKKICTVEVSMGMWGESSGLLGSNDNEADNDWQMSSGKKADNVHDFLNSYEVSKNAQCQLTNSSPSLLDVEDAQAKSQPNVDNSSRMTTLNSVLASK